MQEKKDKEEKRKKGNAAEEAGMQGQHRIAQQ